MPLEVDWPDFAFIHQRLNGLPAGPPVGLLETIEAILYEDNRRGVLAGTDGDGAPLVATVREHTPEGHWVSYTLPDGKPGRYYQAGLKPGPKSPGGDGDGPPLAPDRENSRAVKNYRTAYYEDGPGAWVVFGAWENVLSKDGVPFLPFHFRGEGKLPVRDLAGLRPEGRQQVFEVIDLFAAAVARGDVA